jgi:hypothetical protein
LPSLRTTSGALKVIVMAVMAQQLLGLWWRSSLGNRHCVVAQQRNRGLQTC